MSIIPFEKKWPTVILTPVSIANSVITVSDVEGLHPKQELYLSFGGLNPLRCEVKRILSSTELMVGAPDDGIKNVFNQSIIGPYNGGTLAAYEQNRNPMGMEPVIRAVYAEEPTVALRTHLVDYMGEGYSSTNPLPVTGSGSIQLFTKPYDAITATYPTNVQEIYQSHVGGVTGTVQETVTVNYVDCSKDLILNVARS